MPLESPFPTGGRELCAAYSGLSHSSCSGTHGKPEEHALPRDNAILASAVCQNIHNCCVLTLLRGQNSVAGGARLSPLQRASHF